MRVMHAEIGSTQKLIGNEYVRTAGSDPNDKILESGLKEQVESVKIIHKSLSVEELTRFWSLYFQTNYRLSLAYLATPILIESKKEPVYPLPVQERRIFAHQIRSPIISGSRPIYSEMGNRPERKKNSHKRKKSSLLKNKRGYRK